MRAAVITDGAVRIEERPDPVPEYGQLLCVSAPQA